MPPEGFQQSRDKASASTPVTGTLENRLAAIADRLRALCGWRRALAAFLAGTVSILAMAPFFLWPALFVTLPILLWLIEGSPCRTAGPQTGANNAIPIDWPRLRGAAFAGWWFGLGFHVTGLYWLREAFLVTGGLVGMLWPLGVIGLPGYLALFHGLAAALTVAVPGPALRRVVALALALSATEWLRGHVFTGFPWNVLGLALTSPLTLMQSASVLGIYGLTLVTVVVCAGPAAILAASAATGHVRFKPRLAAALLALGPLLAMTAFGSMRLSAPTLPAVEGVRIRMVQPSIPQREKWQADKQIEFLNRHLDLSRRDANGRQDDMAGITHVIWPEAAMPFLPLQRPNIMAAIGEAIPPGVYLLAGVLRMERAAGEEMRVFNSLAAIDDEGRPVAIYDKTHLVPFGEYLPFPWILESIGLTAFTRQRGGFEIGITPRPLLKIGTLPPAAPLICYEAVFPASAVQSLERPGLLLNVTNDGWFGNSTGPRQHLHQARLRTVEEGLPLLRVANNGITAVFDPFGRELARIGLDVAGVIDTHLPAAVAAPIYARFGDLTFLAVWLILAIGVLQIKRSTRNEYD